MDFISFKIGMTHNGTERARRLALKLRVALWQVGDRLWLVLAICCFFY
jgi:hypothetical protein